MGAEILIIFEKGEKARLKRVLTETNYECPDNYFGKTNVWIEWKGNRLEIGYSAGMACREWAGALGYIIAKNYKLKKAGYSSSSYCETIEEFLRSKPFNFDIKNYKKMIDEWKKNLPQVIKEMKQFKIDLTDKMIRDMVPHYEEQIKKMKEVQKIFLDGAEKIIGINNA